MVAGVWVVLGHQREEAMLLVVGPLLAHQWDVAEAHFTLEASKTGYSWIYVL